MKTLLLLLALAVPAFAQVTPAATGKPKPLSAGDKKFVRDALDGMYFEMELAGKTKTGAKLEGTKTVANTLKTDLDKVWAEVSAVAGVHDEKIPTDLTGGDKSKSEKLGKAGDKFDKEFLKLVSHEADKLAKTFEAAAKSSASDPEIKKIAETWLPTLKEHTSKIDIAEKEAAKTK